METVVPGLRAIGGQTLFVDGRRIFFVAPNPANASEYLVLRFDPK